MDQPELPDLKKKEKERKKAGAAWSYGGGAPGWQGATGGAGAAARGAASAASAAGRGVLSGAGGGARTLIGRLLQRLFGEGLIGRIIAPLMGSFLGELGAAFVLAGIAAVVVGGAGLAVASMMGWGAAKTGPAPQLGGLASSMKVRKESASGGLDWLQRMGRGEAAGAADKAKAAETADKTAADKGAGDAPAQDKTDWKGVVQGAERPSADRLAHNLSGAKLSTSLGGASFGGKDIFANSSAPKFGSIGNALGLNRQGRAQGQMKPNRNAARQQVAGRSRGARLNSRKALGQLKAANALSNAAIAGPTNENAATRAQDAFDGQLSPNGTHINSPTDAPPTTSGGTGGGTTGGGTGTSPTSPTIPTMPTNPTMPTEPTLPTPPDVPCQEGPNNPCNTTPYQDILDRIKQLAAAAGQLKMMGMMLIALGIVLIAMSSLSPWLAVIGAMLVGAGMMMMQMAAQMKAQADQMAQQIAQAQSQTMHAQNTQECIDQAYNNGGATNPNCQGSQQQNFNSTSGTDAVNAGNESYTVSETGDFDYPLQPRADWVEPSQANGLSAAPSGYHYERHLGQGGEGRYDLMSNDGRGNVEQPPAGYRYQRLPVYDGQGETGNYVYVLQPLP